MKMKWMSLVLCVMIACAPALALAQETSNEWDALMAQALGKVEELTAPEGTLRVDVYKRQGSDVRIKAAGTARQERRKTRGPEAREKTRRGIRRSDEGCGHRPPGRNDAKANRICGNYH